MKFIKLDSGINQLYALFQYGSGQPHQNSIQNMFCNRFVKIVLKKMCYLGNKADIADSKTLTMKNNLSDWIFYVSILQPKSFDYDS